MITVHPLRDRVNVDDIIHRIPDGCAIHRAVTLVLPGVDFHPVAGEHFHVWRGRIDLFPGHAWNGASGPAIDTEDTILASLVHDIACTRIHPEGPHILPNYLARHRLYRDIATVQGMTRIRAYTHFAVLVAANWLYEDIVTLEHPQ